MIIQNTFGITQEPFQRCKPELLLAQDAIMDILTIHAQHGGFSVIVGGPGVGKSTLRAHIERLGEHKENEVVRIIIPKVVVVVARFLIVILPGKA